MAIQPKKDRISSASAAGLSAGTGFSGLVLLMPDGVMKSVLLVASPTITVIISSIWHVFTQEIDARFADWRIRSQKKKAQDLYDTLKNGGTADAELLEKARQNLVALTLIEVELTKRRVDAIVSS